MDLTNEGKQFPRFALSVGCEVLSAVLTDSEVLLLTSSGVLLGSRSRRLRGLGVALGGLFIARRFDQYVWVFDSNLKLLSRVISEGQLTRGIDGR